MLDYTVTCPMFKKPCYYGDRLWGCAGTYSKRHLEDYALVREVYRRLGSAVWPDSDHYRFFPNIKADRPTILYFGWYELVDAPPLEVQEYGEAFAMPIDTLRLERLDAQLEKLYAWLAGRRAEFVRRPEYSLRENTDFEQYAKTFEDAGLAL